MTNQVITLKNGLRIACDEMRDVETVSVGVFVNTGSRNEEIKNNGISHFLEHMAFKGTQKRNAKQIAEDFEQIGGRINAYTSKEKTVFYAKVLKKHAEFAVEFLADILQNSTFDLDELEKERKVILQEIAMTNDTPDDIVFDYFHEAAYPNQALGRSILGPVKNIKKFQQKDFLEYIGKQYNYGNIAVVASGNIKSNDLNKWCEKYFTKLGDKKIDKFENANYQGGIFLKDKKLEQVNLVLGYEALSYNDKDFYGAQMLSLIFGGGMSSRLFQRIREELGLAYSIHSFNYAHSDNGVFSIYSATSPDKVEKLVEATLEEINKISDNISENEILRTRNQFEASLLMAKESTSSRMQKIGSDILNFNRIIDSKEILDKVYSYKEQDLSKIAKRIFDNSRPTFAAIGKVKNLELPFI